MTSRLRLLDRTVCLVLGLALVALALLAFDWRYGVVGSYADTLSTSAAVDVVESSWWPWAFAAGALVLALLALAWLLAHLRRPGPGSERLDASDPTGRLEVDLRSAAAAVADRFAELAPVAHVRGTTEQRGRHVLLVVHGHVDPAADADALAHATATCTREVAAAFPDDDVLFRVVLESPRRRRLGGGDDRVRVR
jgi:hypothetical protein